MTSTSLSRVTIDPSLLPSYPPTRRSILWGTCGSRVESYNGVTRSLRILRRGSVTVKGLWPTFSATTTSSVSPDRGGDPAPRTLGPGELTGAPCLRRDLLLEKEAELPLEVARRLEVFVDACVPQVSDLVGLLHGAQDRRPHGARPHLRALLPDARLDPVQQLVDLRVGDRPARQRLADPCLELVSVPRLAGAVALAQDQSDVL